MLVSVQCWQPEAEFHPAHVAPHASSPRWDSSHFKKLGGVQRGSYTIHPEFASEMYHAPAR